MFGSERPKLFGLNELYLKSMRVAKDGRRAVLVCSASLLFKIEVDMALEVEEVEPNTLKVVIEGGQLKP